MKKIINNIFAFIFLVVISTCYIIPISLFLIIRSYFRALNNLSNGNANFPKITKRECRELCHDIRCGIKEYFKMKLCHQLLCLLVIMIALSYPIEHPHLFNDKKNDKI